MKNKILKILEDCMRKGYDDLHFESDRNYIANEIIKMMDDICEINKEQQNER